MHPSLISLSVSPICKDWCWRWNSHTLTTSCKELTHWKRPWCWEGLGAGGEGDDRGWDGWMASPTRWTWVWVNSGSWWWTGRPGMLWFMGSQRVGHDWATELNWTEALFCMEQNQSGSRDCLGEGTKDIKRETGWRPLLQGLVHFQECIVRCLFKILFKLFKSYLNYLNLACLSCPGLSFQFFAMTRQELRKKKWSNRLTLALLVNWRINSA